MVEEARLSEREALWAALDTDGRLVFSYWDSLCGPDESLPRKVDFDPVCVARALEKIQLVDIVEGPEEFRYRLVGTREVSERGFDPTGRSVADGFLGRSADIVLDNYRHVVKTGAPYCKRYWFRKVHRSPIQETSLFLPLADADGRLAHILVYSYQEIRPEDAPESDLIESPSSFAGRLAPDRDNTPPGPANAT